MAAGDVLALVATSVWKLLDADEVALGDEADEEPALELAGGGAADELEDAGLEPLPLAAEGDEDPPPVLGSETGGAFGADTCGAETLGGDGSDGALGVGTLTGGVLTVPTGVGTVVVGTVTAPLAPPSAKSSEISSPKSKAANAAGLRGMTTTAPFGP